jgi:hypothetical protein
MAEQWIKDEHGNQCSVLYFGDEEAARAAAITAKINAWIIERMATLPEVTHA